MQWFAELPVAVRQKSVLLVDDSVLQRELAAELLHSLGLRSVVQAGNGLEALEMLSRLAAQGLPLPLLILDLEMPEMDGIELLQRLDEEGLRPTVVLASGCDETLIGTVIEMIRAYAQPVLGCLTKPLDGQALHGLLQSLAGFDAQLPAAPGETPRCSAEELRLALEQGWIRPHYQPKVALQSGRLLGYEALARWNDPQARALYPSDFIALATESGQLPALTFSLLDQVLADSRRLQTLGAAPSMALNLDVSLLANHSFANELIARVQASGMQASQLILEITESALMHDPAITLGAVGRLRLAGFGLSIVDYGTGFSTLQQLTRLPFTELKIDRIFIAQVQRNRRAHAILQSAIDMSVRLRLPSIAEGVETIEQVRLLQRLGCSAAQGYLFARPMPSEALPDWHLAHAGRDSLDAWL